MSRAGFREDGGPVFVVEEGAELGNVNTLFQFGADCFDIRILLVALLLMLLCPQGRAVGLSRYDGRCGTTACGQISLLVYSNHSGKPAQCLDP